MPKYDYHCMGCGRNFEVEKRMADPHPTVCDACGHDDVQRRFAPIKATYHGSGFYSTDKALYDKVPGYDGPDEG